MVGTLISNSLKLIEQKLAGASRSAVCWSAGKESQVLLYLVRQISQDVPVIHLQGFPDGQKHLFADLVAEAWGLKKLPTKLCSTDVIGKGDHVEIIEEYRLANGSFLYYPIEAPDGHVPGPGSHCAVQKINQPKSDDVLDVDCLFIGHRADDIDPSHGPMPLEDDTAEAGGVLYVYPLKNWTEVDIWRASELLQIPQNEKRYRENRMDWNPDYYDLCTECLKPTGAESIICPKINEPVLAIGRHLNLEERRESWRNRFVNIRRSNEEV